MRDADGEREGRSDDLAVAGELGSDDVQANQAPEQPQSSVDVGDQDAVNDKIEGAPVDGGASDNSDCVVLDMDTIKVSADGAQATELELPPPPSPVAHERALRQSRASKAGSDAMSARTSGAGGDIKSRDFRRMSKLAKSLSKANRLGAGTKSAYQAKMSDIGALGIGLQLYFMLTKYLSVAFLVMGLLALPTIILNYAGHGITVKMADPLQLAYASLGNQGVNDAIAGDPKQCLPMGTIDCNWTTVDTPFTTDPVKVTWIITISDCLYSIFFLLFYFFYRLRARQAIETHMSENLTPAKYAVYVRGLPPDATEREILEHFNSLYDLTKDEETFSLWFGCCYGRRRRVKFSKSKRAVNRSVVTNLDHLAGTTSVTKELYLNTWIAEVSIGHPTGGLLRTFLAMEALTQSIAETRDLVETLEAEKRASPSTFKKSDEKLLQRSIKLNAKQRAALAKKTSRIKELKQVMPMKAAKTSRSNATNKQQLARATVTAAAHAAKTAATNTQQAFNWDACECAFVVFNNLESRRRCLQDYRMSTYSLTRTFQPPLLRFRNGTFPLIVEPAPEPSNILWENLEVTDRGRFYRRSLTYFVTFVLLLISAMIISAAQSAQQQFADKLPPSGLCETKLPQVFYGSSAYTEKKARWKLTWDDSAACAPGAKHETRYYIAYDNGIVNTLNVSSPVLNPTPTPQRCLDPCVSEESSDVCNTLPCFDQALQDSGHACETYAASHVLYCYCSSALASSIADVGYIEGPKRLWRQYLPCRGYITDFAKKNGFIVMAAGVVLLVNLSMDVLLRAFADFERHESESAKASGTALKLFAAQFLNTAVVVLLVNASLGLARVPVLNELLKGKYRDFEREWYPSVGMGITTTMLLNAVLPQLKLFLHMFVLSPLMRELQRRSVRTQEQMNKLYAGPTFDIAGRYPSLLNSVFVTMVFCGGSPILLFIAALSAAGTYWFDKLSLVHLYSVRTAYDEALGEVASGLLPWTLVLHLGFSTWMYGNAALMKAHVLDIAWVLRTCGLTSILLENPGASNDELYTKLLEHAASIDVLGKYGLVVKLLRANVMLIFLFFIGAIFTLAVSTVWRHVLWPLIRKAFTFVYQRLCLAVCGRRQRASESYAATSEHSKRKRPPIVLPEFTDVFRKSIGPRFQPDTLLGFKRTEDGELIRTWQETTRVYGMKRVAGERMRTWEAMQAPTRSYAIETNEKYALAVAELVAAAAHMRVASMKPGVVAPMAEVDAAAASLANGDGEHEERNVLRAVAATDAVEATDRVNAAPPAVVRDTATGPETTAPESSEPVARTSEQSESTGVASVPTTETTP